MAKKKKKVNKKSVSRGRQTPRLPKLSPTKTKYGYYDIGIGKEGCEVKLPAALLYFPPNAVKHKTELKLYVRRKQASQRRNFNH